MIRLITREHPNYFSAPALLTWWGDPVRWEIAVLAVTALCAAALFLLHRHARRPLFVASTLSTPFVFGMLASLFQIHMIFYSLSSRGWSHLFSPETLIFCGLFSSHIGIFSSITLLLLWFGLRTFARAASTPKQGAPSKTSQ